MPTLGEVLPIISLLIAAAALIRNIKGDVKTDQTELTTVIVKLETINENIKDVKADMKDVKVDMDKIKERLTSVEASAKSAHKRIDDFEKDRKDRD